VGAIWLSEYTTALGCGAVAVTVAGVCQVWLPESKKVSWLKSDSLGESETSRRVAYQLECYFQKELQYFDIEVDISGISEFRQQVLRLTMQIPYGTVTTYGQLALQAGSPGAARAVGTALAANKLPIIIPCHRVLAASGALTGFSGAGGLLMKKLLLNLEGTDLTLFKKG